jgi:hypothetical protein
MSEEYKCIHLWITLLDFSVLPCKKCGAIREHVQMVDDLEDAAKAFDIAKGLALNDARKDLIACRAKILLQMRKGMERK